MHDNYLTSVRKQFAYYKALGERTLDQLEDRHLFWQYNAESNSIAIIVHHLWGNMKSRWTDFLDSDGEKPWRQRDLEFEDIIRTREDLQAKWEDGWQCLFDALGTLNSDNFEQLVYIRNHGHTIVEAINRHLAHYAYHVGQMVYVGRMVQGPAWKSLSIAKGQSSEYNKTKFDKPQRRAHFTDDL